MAPDSPVRKVGWPGTRPREPPARSIGDGPAERVPVFDPPDDDKTRDKHVEPKRGVLSDAGSIPAASTITANIVVLLHERPLRLARASGWTREEEERFCPALAGGERTAAWPIGYSRRRRNRP